MFIKIRIICGKEDKVIKFLQDNSFLAHIQCGVQNFSHFIFNRREPGLVLLYTLILVTIYMLIRDILIIVKWN